APRPDDMAVEDTIVESDDIRLEVYHPSPTRTNDLLHTRLELRFNWEKEQVLGKATLTLKPYFYPTGKVTLDAKGFEFHQVSFADSDTPLLYEYDGNQITIDLGRTFHRNEQYQLFFDYTARPSQSGGSNAITSDKGLFFINPRGEDGNKPRQIWTQGETENNSRWFPTIDKPNERCTGEIILTVEDRFLTLSNGLLVSSVKNPDGTRTDYWKMDLPHAPYLFMIAVGEFAVVEDEWNGIPVTYYVEPAFEKYARRIFPHTPEMLSFFSNRLGLTYPWQKYAQVVVRDYVSGAMENTTAVIFGEYVQATERELIDNLQNEKVVAHEMFHHWFGDYVTCESWANLTLNEGFANYSEYLWLEHKYGRDEADFHRLQEIQGYMGQLRQQEPHPLIHYSYDDKEDMFDAHSYNKGGLVLHMLRNITGDEAFFASLNKYLRDNALSDVEADELRLAFEEVTGRDFNWFFDQWFFDEGHPELEVDYDYDENKKEVIVAVKQVQDPDEFRPIFILPFAIDVYTGGKVVRHEVKMDQRFQSWAFPSETDPELIVFDADGVLLANIEEAKSEREYIAQYEKAPNFIHRIRALALLTDSDLPEKEAVFKKALNDKFWLIRQFAVESCHLDESTIPLIEKMAGSDPHSSVREAAILKLASTFDKKYTEVAIKAVNNDPSVKVISAGLQALLNLDKEKALAVAKQLEGENSEGIILTLADLYAQTGDPSHLPYFEEKFDKVNGFAQYGFLESYATAAAGAEPGAMVKVAARLKKVAMDKSKMFWLRFLATKSINDLHRALMERMQNASEEAATVMNEKDAELVKLLEEIINWETDVRIKGMYANFPDPAP
ncbi:MAG TPA: alanyl aminopeptidase, partial [Bacteroidetes bacterium]|nr:alanyl aminopeptidase [Bacteroidota bacterium]